MWTQYCEEKFSPEKFNQLLEEMEENARRVVTDVLEIYPIAEDVYYVLTCQSYYTTNLAKLIISTIIDRDPYLAYEFLMILEPNKTLINYFLETLLKNLKPEHTDFLRWFIVKYIDFVDLHILGKVGRLFSDEEFVALMIHAFYVQNFSYVVSFETFLHATISAKPHIGIWLIRQIREKRKHRRPYGREDYERWQKIFQLPLKFVDAILKDPDPLAIRQMVLYLNEAEKYTTLISFLNKLYKKDYGLFLHILLTISLPKEVIERLEPIYKSDFRKIIANEPWLIFDLNPWKILSVLFDTHRISPEEIIRMGKPTLEKLRKYLSSISVPKLVTRRQVKKRKYKFQFPKTAEEILRLLEMINREILSINELSKMLGWRKSKVMNYVEILSRVNLTHYLWRFDEVSSGELSDIFVKLIRGEYK